MIRHVVLMKFKEGAPESRLVDLEKGLRALPGHIPEIKSYEFGLDVVRSDRSYDFGLISSFNDLESLKQYQNHPEHLKILDIIREICENIIAVDYTY